MPTASTFRAALGVAAVLLLIALAALITHVIQPAHAHPFVGLTLGLLLLLVVAAAARGVFVNDNRPARG